MSKTDIRLVWKYDSKIKIHILHTVSLSCSESRHQKQEIARNLIKGP